MRLSFVRVAAAVAVLAGCSDSSGPRVRPEVGNYVLASVNGALLPAVVIDNPGFRGEVVSGILFLLDDGIYKELRTSRVTTGSGVSTIPSETNGTYTISGTAVTLTIPASGAVPAITYSGVLNSNILTVTADGTTYRYERVLPD